MKRFSALFAIVFCIVFMSVVSGFSQGTKPGLRLKPGVILGANVLYSKPAGTFGNNYGAGAGVEVLGGIGLGKTYLVASTGYTYYMGRSGTRDLTNNPIKIGLRQYLLGKRFFVNADIGRATINDKNKGVKEVHNLRGFGGGARLLGLEAAVQYEGWDNTGSQGFSNNWQYKLGYNITL